MADQRTLALRELKKYADEETGTCCQTLASMAPVHAYIDMLERAYTSLTGDSLEEESATDMADET